MAQLIQITIHKCQMAQLIQITIHKCQMAQLIQITIHKCQMVQLIQITAHNVMIDGKSYSNENVRVTYSNIHSVIQMI